MRLSTCNSSSSWSKDIICMDGLINLCSITSLSLQVSSNLKYEAAPEAVLSVPLRQCSHIPRRQVLMAGLGNTYGAALVGTCISAVLYGVTILQVFMCFREYPQDKFWDKLGVCLLLILDSLHTTFCIYAMYWYLVINFGVFPELAMMHWSFEAQQMLNVLVISGVHTLYIVRICKLEAVAGIVYGRYHFRPILLSAGIALCVAYATALESCYEISTLKIFASAFESGHLWIMYYSLSIASCIDIFIAASLCYLLSRCRTGFCKTDSLISWLMFYTINTGLVTSMCSLVAVIMLAVFPRTFLTVAFQFVQVKLYINSYLAMLNARSSLRRHRDGSLGGGLSIPRSMIFMPSNSAGEANGVTIIPDPCNSNPSVRVQSNTRTGRHSSMSVEIDPRRDAHGGVLHIYKDASLAQSHETLVVINTRLRDSCPHVDADNNPYDNRRPTVRRPSPTFARRTSVVFI